MSRACNLDCDITENMTRQSIPKANETTSPFILFPSLYVPIGPLLLIREIRIERNLRIPTVSRL